MLDFIYQLTDLHIFLLMCVTIVTISVLFIILNRYFIFYRLHYRDNATIGSISSLIGIIYGVLVGFIALYLIGMNNTTQDAVQREADAVANIYRESLWLTNPAQTDIQVRLKSYIKEVVNDEWPLMRQGAIITPAGDEIIEGISEDLRLYKPVSNSEMLVMTSLITEVKNLYGARHQRIIMAASSLSPELWEVILIGTILIIAINYAFRVNFYLHLFALCAFSIMAASMLFLLVTLDRPFQGEFIIEADALKAVLVYMEAKAKP